MRDDLLDPEGLETEEVVFRFEEQHGDIGTCWVMCDEDGSGFWDLFGPLVPR